MNRLIVITLLVLALGLQVGADVIYLNEGEEVFGHLKNIDSNQVLFETLKGDEQSYSVASIAHILISRIRKGDDIDDVAKIVDPVAAGIMQNLPDPKDFPDADYVTLFRLNEYRYTADNKLLMRNREIIMILKEPGLNKANQSAYYYSNRENCELEFAHTYSPSGKVFHITDNAISDESLMSATPEYDKLKKMKFAMKNVDIGCVIDFSYVRTLSDLNELQPYAVYSTFGEKEPILHQELSISFPENVKMEKILAQWQGDDLPKFFEKQIDGATNWKWVYANPKGYIPEQNMLPLSRIFPRVVVYRPYPWSVISKSLAGAYDEARPDQALLDDLLKRAGINEKTGKYESVNRIYELINRDIRDVDMSITHMGSFKPVSANITLNKKYGNTQSMLALMHFAFQKLGIESYVGFCGGRREKVTVKDHSSLGVTDYAVLKVVIDGRPFYTDGGSIYKPFGVIPTWLQGSIAGFHNQADSSFFFEELPRQTLEWNRFDRNVLVKILLDGSMEVNETLNYRGPYEAGTRELRSLKDKEKQNYAERRIKRVHPRAVLKGFGFSNLDDLNAPVVISLSYVIPEAAQLASDKIMTFTNFWVNYTSGSASLAKRKYPMQYWACEENQQTIVFEMPDGYRWVDWERQYQHRSPELEFFSSIHQNDNRLIYADRFVANIDEFLTDEQYQNYRSCILTMSELANQWIILEKPEILASPAGNDEVKEIQSAVEQQTEVKEPASATEKIEIE